MSTKAEVTDMLASASRGSRTLDGQVATALGWRRRLESYIDLESGEKKNRNYWVITGEDEPIICPPFTSSIQAAFELTARVFPRAPVACCDLDGLSKAAINNSDHAALAATLPIALSLTVLIAIE